MDYMAEAAKYEAKADEQYWNYQDSGSPSTLRSCERNREMAEALRLAAAGKQLQRAFSDLKWCVLSINADADPERVVKNVKHVQKRLSEGWFDA